MRLSPPLNYKEAKTMGYMFDIGKIIKESGLSHELIQKLEKEIRQEFPTDEMMYELHLMRAIDYEKNKGLTSDEKIRRLKEKRNNASI